MGAMKAFGAGVFGVFAEDITTVSAYAVHSVMAGAPDNVQSAIAHLFVGALAAAVTYYIPNKATS